MDQFSHKDFDPLAYLRHSLKQSGGNGLKQMNEQVFRLQVCTSEATNNLMQATRLVVKEVTEQRKDGKADHQEVIEF